MGASLGRALAAIAVLFMAGCTLSVDANRKQCKVDGDCHDRGFGAETVCREGLCSPPPPPADWACLSDPPPSAPPATERFIVKSRAQEIVPARGVPGASVKVCAKLDRNCESPQGPIVITDDNGDFEVEVVGNFSGYLQLEKDSWVTVRYFFYPNVRENWNLASIQMVTKVALPGLVAYLQAPAALDRGIFLISAWNCLNQAASDVVFETSTRDDATKTFYARGTLPNPDATQTDSAGYGGFVNVPAIGGDGKPGVSVIVTGVFKPSGERIAELSLVSYPESLTISRMVHLGDP